MPRPRKTVADFTDPYIEHFTPPPPAREGVCNVCHGAPNPGWVRCFSCSQTIGQVTKPVELVVPISLYHGSGQLHHVLRSYKDGWDEETRAALRPRVAALLWRFISNHADCITGAAGADWDMITVVPSTSRLDPAHPLERIIAMAEPLAEQFRRVLSRGNGPLSHNQASDTGYVVTDDIAGINVLVVDDTFTTGARIQSAASALALAGANVVAAVPIGRFINPGFNEATTALWEKARAELFDFDVCCLEL